MTLLTWNIHGGGARVPRIVEEIAAHDPDVIALTACRAAPEKELRAGFAGRGWSFFESTGPSENEKGIAVFARTPLRALPCPAAPEHRDRWPFRRQVESSRNTRERQPLARREPKLP